MIFSIELKLTKTRIQLEQLGKGKRIVFFSNLNLCSRIDGKLKWISASNGTIWGVNSNDDIFYASDISFDGKDQVHLKWNKVDGKLKQVSVFWKPLWESNWDNHDCPTDEDCRLTHSQLICDSAGLLEAHVSFADLQGQVANFADLVVGGIVADSNCRG